MGGWGEGGIADSAFTQPYNRQIQLVIQGLDAAFIVLLRERTLG